MPVEAKMIVKIVYLQLVERGLEKQFSLQETSTLWRILRDLGFLY